MSNFNTLKIEITPPKPKIKTELIIPNKVEGLSAYQIAVDNGFKGSIEDWLNSIRGESGVYIGDTEPANKDVNVWIDTSTTVPSDFATVAKVREMIADALVDGEEVFF